MSEIYFEVEGGVEDCISRQSVLNTIYFAEKFLNVERTVEKYEELLMECVKFLPPAENKGEEQMKRSEE